MFQPAAQNAVVGMRYDTNETMQITEVLAYGTAVSLRSHYGSFIGKQNGTEGITELYESFLEYD
jgi:Putative heavy-metal-binding